MLGMTWQFPRNEFEEPEGFGHAGISHFTDNREINLIRESIQNSLDARAGDLPVRVDCALQEMPLTAFSGAELRQIFGWAIDSPHNDEKGRGQFDNGKRLLDYERRVTTLCIKDSNTTGARDVPRRGGAPSQWESLTKGSGLPAKEQKDAAGSFGIGKHSAFAVTDLRTVLYSTAWRDSERLNRRFIGKAILVSHIDGDGNHRRGTGYLSTGESNAPPFKDNDVPHPFGLTEQGTAIYIPGYRRPANQGRPAWQRARMADAINNYFHAIVRGNLVVSVNGDEVNADNISEKYNALGSGEKSNRTVNFIRVSQSDPVATEHFDGIGQVNLRIRVYDDQKVKSREIALVRDSGMMITSRPADMAMGLGSISSLWRGFTAIIECISGGQSSYIRESESPKHDRLSDDYIDDSERKRAARAQLAEMGRWIKAQIEAKAGFQTPESDDYVDELAKYFPNLDDDSPAGDFDRPATVSITGLRQSRATGGGAGLLVGEHGGGGGRGGRRRLPRRGDRSGGTGGGGGNTGTGQRPPRPVTGIRVRPVRGETQWVTASFDNPGQTLSEVQLVAVGEDGAQYPLHITEASSGGGRIDVADGVIHQLPDNGEARYQLIIRTIEPVIGKTFRLVGRNPADNRASGGTG